METLQRGPSGTITDWHRAGNIEEPTTVTRVPHAKMMVPDVFSSHRKSVLFIGLVSLFC